MGEYEPEDSRNITGTASTPDGRWTNIDGKPPLEAGGHVAVKKGDKQNDPRANRLTDEEAEEGREPSGDAKKEAKSADGEEIWGE